MSSKKQLRNLYSNKTEQKSGLSRHYRQIGIKAVAAAIGIKAVAAATRKENSTSPRTGGSTRHGKRSNTEGGHNE
jgi:hypothetical protein